MKQTLQLFKGKNTAVLLNISLKSGCHNEKVGEIQWRKYITQYAKRPLSQFLSLKSYNHTSPKIIQPTSGTAERQPLQWILYIEQIQEYDYLVKVLLIGDSAVGNLNFCPDLLGTRSAYFRFTFIYLYTCLYVLCNLDPGCLYIYACSYNNFFFWEKIVHIIWIWDFFFLNLSIYFFFM